MTPIIYQLADDVAANLAVPVLSQISANRQPLLRARR